MAPNGPHLEDPLGTLQDWGSWKRRVYIQIQFTYGHETGSLCLNLLEEQKVHGYAYRKDITDTEMVPVFDQFF
ncbi:hypothetical protein CEXT_3151 [Caerostris extrusa]|uniref:Uncharacterized protein n=1 Tax=Caerostris extrusa TaxID=172846 RepID=A0AAV4WKB9_CAEEX|nr:hypothetical protein CEXT_3151 [Caerostris extrusa]